MRSTNGTTDTFGPRLQRIRESRYLTQTELATAIGKSSQTISAWENGAATPQRGDVDSCAKALLCRRYDLLAPVEAPVPPCRFWSRVKRRLQRIAARPDPPPDKSLLT